MITIIIPFLNEGDEVYNTIKSIRDTAGPDVPVILINDASTDNYDYRSVAVEFDCVYLKNEIRKGVAFSRDTAISLINTPYFLLLDAHMRFYSDDWHEILLRELEDGERALFCCQTKSILKKEDGSLIEKKRKMTYGAYINFDDNNLSAVWSEIDPDPESNIVSIPCVLGAGYACSKTYWQYLRGLSGLRSYGKDEQLISLKVWMEGGQCKLIKNIEIGHFYRTEFPYTIPSVDYIFNLLYLAELFLPASMKEAVHKNISQYPENYKEGLAMIEAYGQYIEEQKKYYTSIFTTDLEKIIEYNRSVDRSHDDK